MVRRIALLAALLFTLPAAAQEGAKEIVHKYSVKKDASSLTYKLKHKLHEVVGTAKPSVGMAQLKADGTLQVQVRANVKDFDSGNGNRDAHMQEVTEAAKFPLVDLKGKVKNFKMPDTFPAKVPVTLEGELTFHGIKQPVTFPMTVVFNSATEAVAEGTFDISLDAYKVERPSLLMVKVDDKLVLEPKLVFQVEGK
jgi:polyisoprenoid-binding protein YceI